MDIYFLEYLPEKLDGLSASFVLALTPEVCFALDEAGISYCILSDFAWPEEIEMVDLRREMISIGERFGHATAIVIGERWRSRNYYERFFEGFLKAFPDCRIVYVGDKFRHLICLVEGHNERKD